MKHLVLILFSGVLLAQQQRVSRVIEFEPDGTEQILKFADILRAGEVGFHAEPLLGIATIYANSVEKLDEAERTVKKYYKPKKAAPASEKNVEIVLYVLQGRTTNEPSETVAALNPVIAQLKQVTPLTSFRTVETQIARVREGKRMEVSGMLLWPDVPETALPTYQLRADVLTKGALVRIDNLNFGARLPVRLAENNFQFREFGMNTSIDIKPGQQVVVGKTNVAAKDGALILVVSARLVD